MFTVRSSTPRNFLLAFVLGSDVVCFPSGIMGWVSSDSDVGNTYSFLGAASWRSISEMHSTGEFLQQQKTYRLDLPKLGALHGSVHITDGTIHWIPDGVFQDGTPFNGRKVQTYQRTEGSPKKLVAFTGRKLDFTPPPGCSKLTWNLSF